MSRRTRPPAVSPLPAPAPPPWQVELGPGTCMDPRLGILPGRPTRLWRRTDPNHVYVVDDRHPGETFEHGLVQIELITLAQALDLLAAHTIPAPIPAAPPPQGEHLHRNEDVAALLGISATTLYELIRRMPPESCGAALLIGGIGGQRRRRRWVRAALERWLAAATSPADATPTPTPTPPTPPHRRARPLPLPEGELPHTAAARAARERLTKP